MTDPPTTVTPMSDLFASAVHRFGQVWADLIVAAVAVHATGGTAAEAYLVAVFTYAIAYFGVLGWVVLRGLPGLAPRRRVVWTYMTAGLMGILAGVLVRGLGTFALVPLPLLLFAVPAIAAGDVQPAGALTRSVSLAVRNFARTWLVWIITVLFSAPVVLAMFLIVDAFTDAGTALLIGLALSVPIVWPFSALFVRALYGDLTGRAVVAPQDRTA